MPDILEPMVKKFTESFSSVLVFVFVFTIFYAIFRKSKVLGESPAMNGAVSFVIAFLVTWFSVSIMPLTTALSTFFTQGTALLLFVIFGIIAASLFYPDLPKMMAEQFKSRTALWIMIILGIFLFVTSGIISVFWAQATQPPKPGETRPATDVIVVSAAIIIFVIVLTVAAAAGGGK
jgi:uncharacterized membrane protein